jgi:hypothetical protein
MQAVTEQTGSIGAACRQAVKEQKTGSIWPACRHAFTEQQTGSMGAACRHAAPMLAVSRKKQTGSHILVE